MFVHNYLRSAVESTIGHILKSLPGYLSKHVKEYHTKPVERIGCFCSLNLEELFIFILLQYTFI